MSVPTMSFGGSDRLFKDNISGPTDGVMSTFQEDDDENYDTSRDSLVDGPGNITDRLSLLQSNLKTQGFGLKTAGGGINTLG